MRTLREKRHMASVHEPDFAWMTRPADSADAWRNADEDPQECLDSASTAPLYCDEVIEEQLDELRHDEATLTVAEDFAEAESSEALTSPRFATIEIVDSVVLDQLVPYAAPVASLPSKRKTRGRRSFVYRLWYFGSSAFAALAAVIVILRIIGVNLFELNGPWGLQPAIAFFVEVIVLTSAAIATCADLRDVDSSHVRAQKPRAPKRGSVAAVREPSDFG